MSRYRAFSCTLNNYNDIEYNDILEFAQVHSKYYIIGKEVGKNTNTPHLQFYIYMKDGISKSAFERYIKTNRCHIEFSKGNHYHNYIYCSKDGDFVTNMNEDEIKKICDKKKTPKKTEAEIFKETMEKHFPDNLYKSCLCKQPNGFNIMKGNYIEYCNGNTIDEPYYDCRICNEEYNIIKKCY